MKIPYYMMFIGIIALSLVSYSFGKTDSGLGGFFCKIRDFFAGLSIIVCLLALGIMALLGIWI